MYKLCFCQLYYVMGYDLLYDLAVAHGARVSQKGSGGAGTQQKTHSHPTPDGYEN